jgi:orotate phosphoribosyltransferase
MELVEHFQPASLPERVQTNLESLTFKKTVGVGGTEVVQARQYIDLMGGTTNPAVAMMFARYLETFWRDRILASAADPTIDFVVTPKTGSPILGYEFARGVNLLFVMHSRDPKFRVQPDEFRAHFDCISQPPEGSRGLIIDDSTTGGDKILELLDDLRKFGYTASDCLIVFEPQLKKARRKLTDKGIRLHSVVKV